MRKLLFILLIAALLAGCGDTESDLKNEFDRLQEIALENGRLSKTGAHVYEKEGECSVYYYPLKDSSRKLLGAIVALGKKRSEYVILLKTNDELKIIGSGEADFGTKSDEANIDACIKNIGSESQYSNKKAMAVMKKIK